MGGSAGLITMKRLGLTASALLAWSVLEPIATMQVQASTESENSSMD